ncbi:unnamed protein product [Cunninghamella blakesleeana]
MNEDNNIGTDINDNELKKIYQFLAYLIHDWSNRAWVICEYQIAKQSRTSLKYIFMLIFSSFGELDSDLPFFFSYTFINQDDRKTNINDSTVINCYEVGNINTFIRFLELTFIQRNHIDMIIKSNASRNQDRFYAILTSWDKYKHLTKSDADLWEKARLLLYYSTYNEKPIIPPFATHYHKLILEEIDAVDAVHKELLEWIPKFEIKISEKYNNNNMDEFMKDYHKTHKSIFKQNLIDIQFKKQKQKNCLQLQHYLSVKANVIFKFNGVPNISREDILYYSLKNNDDLKLIYIPFFTYSIPELSHTFPLDKYLFPFLSGTLLLGSEDKNRWVLYLLSICNTFGKSSLSFVKKDFVYNIY